MPLQIAFGLQAFDHVAAHEAEANETDGGFGHI